MLHTCVQRLYVMENFKKIWKLNKARDSVCNQFGKKNLVSFKSKKVGFGLEWT